MSPETFQALAAVLQAQRSANMSAIAAIIEVVKLLPAGPSRDPVLDKLQDLIDRTEAVNMISEPLSEALRVEAKNATRP